MVWKWRKAFGVGGRKRTTKSAAARRLGLRPSGRWAGREWTPAQLALLGTDHDDAIARRLGRTRAAVSSQRRLRKVPAFAGWAGGGPGWNAAEVALLGTRPDAEVALRIGRTVKAVQAQRAKKKVAAFAGAKLADPSGLRVVIPVS